MGPVFALIEAVEELLIPVFDQQDSRMSLVFLSQGRCGEEDIVDCLKDGLMPMIARQAHEHFTARSNRIRFLCHQHRTNKWERGPAKAMLDHHTRAWQVSRLSALIVAHVF